MEKQNIRQFIHSEIEAVVNETEKQWQSVQQLRLQFLGIREAQSELEERIVAAETNLDWVKTMLIGLIVLNIAILLTAFSI